MTGVSTKPNGTFLNTTAASLIEIGIDTGEIQMLSVTDLADNEDVRQKQSMIGRPKQITVRRSLVIKRIRRFCLQIFNLECVKNCHQEYHFRKAERYCSAEVSDHAPISGYRDHALLSGVF